MKIIDEIKDCNECRYLEIKHILKAYYSSSEHEYICKKNNRLIDCYNDKFDKYCIPEWCEIKATLLKVKELKKELDNK